MNNNKVGSYIGFAIKARKCLFGYDAIYKSQKVQCIIYSDDLSEKSAENLRYYAERNEIPIYSIGSAELKDYVSRDGVKAIGITDINLAGAIDSQLNEDRD